MTNKEYTEALVQLRVAIAKLKTAHKKDAETIHRTIELRATATSDALRLQAKEYKRRLNDLNGEADRLRKMQESYVPRETYNELDKRVGELQSFKEQTVGRHSMSTYISIGALVISIVTLVLEHVLK